VREEPPALLKFRQSLAESQPYLYQYRPAFLRQFFAVELRCNAWQQGYRHQLSQNFPDHLPADNASTKVEPIEPAFHKLKNRRVDGIFP